MTLTLPAVPSFLDSDAAGLQRQFDHAKGIASSKLFQAFFLDSPAGFGSSASSFAVAVWTGDSGGQDRGGVSTSFVVAVPDLGNDFDNRVQMSSRRWWTTREHYRMLVILTSGNYSISWVVLGGRPGTSAQVSSPEAATPETKAEEDQQPVNALFISAVVWLFTFVAGYVTRCLWRQASAWKMTTVIRRLCRVPSAAIALFARVNGGEKPSEISSMTSSVVCGFFFPVLTKARLISIAKDVVSPRQVCVAN